ncbi:hypothetical protein C8J56DRAFT_890752 [Mycena floridula]|nr:hypothetical protein C8J56DRAFT_890752 [Mycena floridula]
MANADDDTTALIDQNAGLIDEQPMLVKQTYSGWSSKKKSGKSWKILENSSETNQIQQEPSTPSLWSFLNAMSAKKNEMDAECPRKKTTRWLAKKATKWDQRKQGRFDLKPGPRHVHPASRIVRPDLRDWALILVNLILAWADDSSRTFHKWKPSYPNWPWLLSKLRNFVVTHLRGLPVYIADSSEMDTLELDHILRFFELNMGQVLLLNDGTVHLLKDESNTVSKKEVSRGHQQAQSKILLGLGRRLNVLEDWRSMDDGSEGGGAREVGQVDGVC